MAVASSAHHKLLLLRSSTLNLRSISNFYIGAKNSGIASFSASSPSRNGQEETPLGGYTNLHPSSSSTVWPDSVLGILAPNDPRFALPGHVGLVEAVPPKTGSAPRQVPDILTRSTCRERQAQVLYTASDFIHYTRGNEDYVCAGVLDDLPEMSGVRNFEFSLHDAPKLLKRDVQDLFPDRDVISGNLSVICLSQKTMNDMSTWSEDVEKEREVLTEQFIGVAKEICGRLRSENYWCDFIDPTCGKPYFGANTNTTMFETDEKYRLLGFRIEDLGCCKVICHKDFGRNVFVGTIFTSAHMSNGVVQDLVEELQVIARNKKPAEVI